MIASISGRPYCTARTTDSGLPPTPIQVFSEPFSIGGYTDWFFNSGRTEPFQFTGSCFRSSANRSSFSVNSFS